MKTQNQGAEAATAARTGSAPSKRMTSAWLLYIAWPWWVGPQKFWRRHWPKMVREHRQTVLLVPWGILVAVLLGWRLMGTQPLSPEVPDAVTFLPSPSVILRALIDTWRDAILSPWPMPYGLQCAYWSLLAVACYAAIAAYIGFGLLAPWHVFGMEITVASGEQSHGTARWMSPAETETSRHIVPSYETGKLVLGEFPSGDLYGASGHVVTFAPTRAGKGVSGIVPNLLCYPGAVFVFDPKGENFAITANARIKMGQSVACLDPFGASKNSRSHAVNWLDGIDPATEESITEAASLADALVIRGDAKDGHWDDSAAYFLQGLILYVCTMDKPLRHMGTVREIMTAPAVEMYKHLKVMSQHAGAAGVIARAANVFREKDSRERAGVLSTAQRHTHFLDDPRIVRTMVRTDFTFSQLRDGKLTIYLIMPPNRLDTYSRYTRGVLTLALREMMRNPPKATVPDTLFILDEFAKLRRFQPAEDMVSIVGGYGVKMWLFLQDLPLLKANYEAWSTFLSNATVQSWATSDLETMRHISDTIGNTTVAFETSGNTHTHSSAKGSTGGSTSRSLAYAARPLMTPDEVRRHDDTECIVIARSEPAVRLKRLKYYSDERLKGLASKNPFFTAAG